MTDWKECKLGEVGVVVTGKTPSSKNPEDFGNDIPFVTPTDYKNYNKTVSFSDRYLSSIGADKLKKKILPPKSVMVTCIGSDMGKVAMNTIPVITNQQINSILPAIKKVDPDFLYYKLVELYDVLRSYGLAGTAVPIVNKTDFERIDILLPSLPEQRAIASVLSSLDNKIDLLYRQNKTLEGMAEALWRKMFVEEADPGWKKGKLGDVIITIESGRRPKGGIDPDLQFGLPSIGAENIIGIGNYNHNKTKYVSEDFYNEMNNGKVQDYDVLIYKDGAYIGRKSMFACGFPFKECCVNEHVFILRTKDINTQLFLYFLLEQEELEQLNANSAQPGLNQESMKSFEIFIPDEKCIEIFGNETKVMIDKIFLNSIQIRTLSRLRDLLLPKLMSGEVKVRE